MMLRKIAGTIQIRTSTRFKLLDRKFISTNNKPTIEPNKNSEKSDGSLTHHDSYRDLDKLDFMTATKILFTTPPKQKKFGLDFHLVQLFFVCLPSLAVYLVAQYARQEMKKMDAELERRQIEEAKKMKEKEGEVFNSNPQLMEVKERLDSLEKTVKEIVTESKMQRSVKVEGEIPQKTGVSIKEKKGFDKRETNGRGDNQKKVVGGNEK